MNRKTVFLNYKSLIASAVVALIFVFAGAAVSAVAEKSNAPYDIVIKNGRVMDPDTNFDAMGYNVGIRGSTITAVTKDDIKGTIEIDAKGRAVTPGFIDVLSYDPIEYGVKYKISDGVTTNLALHGGTVKMGPWYKSFEGKTAVNFGAAFFYMAARGELGISIYKAATGADIEKLKKTAQKALDDGALAIGISLEYAPGITAEEVEAMARIAAAYKVPVFFHARYSDMEEPGTNFDALREIIDVAKKTGAAVHVDHINSTGGTFSMNESVAMVKKAIADGIDITACIYPYDYWATHLNMARFDGDWQKRFRIGYNDLQLGASTERLTEESFKKYRKQGKLAVAYAIPAEDVVAAIKAPFVMIGSDGILNPGNNNHPRGAGAFVRTIAVYAREKNVITLMEAIAKMTIMPAKRLERGAPVFKKKGRLSVGADADILIFDPENVRDTATVVKPNSHSVGMDYVIVGGVIVKDENGVRRNVAPGRALKSSR